MRTLPVTLEVVSITNRPNSRLTSLNTRSCSSVVASRAREMMRSASVTASCERALCQRVAALPGLVDEFLTLCLRLIKHFAVLGLRLGELGFDLFRVGLPLGDPAAAFFQHVDDRPKGIGLQNVQNDAERGDLREKPGPVETENLRNAFVGGEKKNGKGLHDRTEGMGFRTGGQRRDWSRAARH